MSIGISTDFKIYDEQFWGGVAETLQTNVDLFNEGSAGCIRLLTRMIKGNYERESFLKRTSGLVVNRDNNSISDAADVKLSQDEYIGVKVNKRIGPVAGTLDEFKKMGEDPSLFSFLFGQQVGKEIASDFLESAIASAVISITDVAALNYDATGVTPSKAGVGSLDHDAMVVGMSKFGDAAVRIKAFVMHSKPFFDLLRNTIADKIVDVANVAIYAGTPASFGRPVIVSDTTALTTAVSGSPNNPTYNVLGLVEDAVVVEESEQREIVSQLLTGKDNLYMRIQGELAYNLRVKGCKWDTSSGGLNPSLATLGTSGNWDQVASSTKDMGGIRIKVK